MHIENEVKLDFKDVLIRPKRSTLKSRSEVELSREFIFRNSRKRWCGVPIIAANMDTTGTFEMAKVFAKHKALVALSKHIETDKLKDFLTASPECKPFTAVSSGLSETDFNKLKETMAASPVDMICLDVANGYSEHFVDYVAKVRAEFPDKIIMAGNVVTGMLLRGSN